MAAIRRWIRRTAKRVLGRYPFAMIPALFVYNLWWAARLATHRTTMEFQETTRHFSAVQAADYVEGLFNQYKTYSGVRHSTGRAAEIGPGGNAGVALLLRADGCEEVELVDRFAIRVNAPLQEEVYAELSRRHDLDAFRRVATWDSHALSGVEWKEGIPAEGWAHEMATLTPGSYDLIGSHAALQCLSDPLGALRDIVTCLRRGGHSVHRIDLRDHGYFSQAGDDLRWLTIPGWLWPWLTRYAGLPNRVLVHRYRQALETLRETGLIEYSILVTRLVSIGILDPPAPFEEIDQSLRQQAMAAVESIRQKLATEFQHVPASDLAVGGILVVIEKL